MWRLSESTTTPSPYPLLRSRPMNLPRPSSNVTVPKNSIFRHAPCTKPHRVSQMPVGETSKHPVNTNRLSKYWPRLVKQRPWVAAQKIAQPIDIMILRLLLRNPTRPQYQGQIQTAVPYISGK